MLRYNITVQNGMPWVAIDPATKLIYSAVWNDCCYLQVYNIDFSFAKPLQIKPNLPSEVQGGAFYNGFLYVCTNRDDGIWKINVETGDIEFVLSDIFPHHQYEVCIYTLNNYVHD